MTLAEGEQAKPRRHNSQPRRQKVNAKPSSSDKQASAALPLPPKTMDTPTKPNPIQRRGSPNVAQQNRAIVDANRSPPTPPRRSSMYDTFDGLKNGEVSASELKGQRRRKSDKIQGHKHSGSISQMPSFGTPQSTERKHSMTPGRSNGTPLQAYAGPTFHASPAASALPLPKFFSKSVPAADKGSSLSAMMEKEVSGVSPEPPSDGSEDSPTFGKAQRAGVNQVGEETPLDIFFRADRMEKARQQSECIPNSSVGAIHDAGPSSALDPSSGSAVSPSKDARHHARHATNNSVGELFSLEIDDKSPNTILQKPSEHSARFKTGSIRPTSAPPHTDGQADNEEEQRKAKTLLLKQLLMSPQLQSPATSTRSQINQSDGESSPRQQSPRGQPSPRPKTLGRATSIPGSYSNVSGQDPKNPASLPRLQNFVTSKEKSTGSPRPRPHSSNLRKEVRLPTSPARADLPELPATPTPSRASNQNLYPESEVQPNNNVSGNTPPFAPDFSSNKIFHGMDNASTQGSKSTKSMEDDLRRILKLNILGGNSANGVRS